MGYEVYENRLGLTQLTGDTWPAYSARFANASAEELAAELGDRHSIVAVTEIRGNIYLEEELDQIEKRHANATRQVVRGGRSAILTITDGGWIGLQWSERPGLGFAITGFNISKEELSSVAESLRSYP